VTDKAVVPHPRRAGSVGAPLDLREQLLEASGLTLDRQAGLLSKAVNVTENLLDAERAIVYVTETRDAAGQLTRNEHIRMVADNGARQRAAEHVTDLVGAKAPRADARVTVRVRLELPEWATADMRPVIDVVPLADDADVVPSS